MSEQQSPLEALLDGLSTTQAAKLLTVANQISREADRAGIGATMEDVAGLIQVRDSVFHGETGVLDEIDLQVALANLRAKIGDRKTDIIEEAGATVDANGDIDLSSLNPAARLALHRKLEAAGGPANLGGKKDREILAYQMAKPVDQMTPAERMAYARRNGGSK